MYIIFKILLLVIVLVEGGCDSNLDVKTKKLNPKSPKISEQARPKVVEPGEVFIIGGSNFTKTTVVMVDGEEVETTFVSPEELKIKIPSSATKKLNVYLLSKVRKSLF